jgi:hypothetical protein
MDANLLIKEILHEKVFQQLGTPAAARPQQILWTALPDGQADDGSHRVKFSVLVSPRLQNGARLDAFDDFLDWPRTLSRIRFRAHVGGDSFSEGAELQRAAQASSELWNALFLPETFVRPHTFDDFSEQLIHSYPALNVLGFIREQYTKIGIAASLNLPTIESLTGDDSFGQIALDTKEDGRGRRRKMLREQIAAIRPHALPPGPRNPPLDFAQVEAFHTTNPPRQPSEVPPISVPKIDFHQMVSLLGEHPEILRALGLIVDFTLKLPSLPVAGAELWIEPLWEPAMPTESVTPHTVLQAGSFLAAPRDPAKTKLAGRFLKLRSKEIGVVQVDIDGAALKAMNFAGNLQQTVARKTEDTPKAASVPSLRTGGLSIVQTGRGAALGEKLANAKTLDAATLTNSVRLFAEDILRGWRVDVREIDGGAPGEWFSLCRRDGIHEFAGTAETISYEGHEGTAAMGVMKKSQKDFKDDLFLHESMFRWGGWSLSVPPEPGLATDNVTPAPVAEKPPFAIRSKFLVHGEQPVLRFGRTYQFRVRTVDLAGNSLPPAAATQDDSLTEASDGFYARFEPVGAPAIVANRDLHLSPGESAERLVVRSNFDQTPEEYLTTLPEFDGRPLPAGQQQPEFDSADFHATSERWIGPPKVGAETAETHGMFDAMSAAEASALRKRNGTLDQADFSTPGFALPYLPDPFAAGATFVGLPGRKFTGPLPQNDAKLLVKTLLEQIVDKVSFRREGATWPDLRAFRIEAAGIPAGATASLPKLEGETLFVSVPQAEVARFRLSSFIDETQTLAMMGIWRWIDDGIPKLAVADDVKKQISIILRAFALHGLHWMLEPFREITIVHAVQQPLLEPAFKQLDPHRLIGATYAQFEGVIHCDGKSTGKLDVVADWLEPVDDPVDPLGPRCAQGPQPPVPHKAHAFAFALNFPGGTVPDAEVELTDSKTHIGMFDQRHPQFVFTNATTRENLPRHDFGDTKYRLVDYVAVGTTRFREYFHCVITADEANVTRRSAVAARHILSSARPDAPKVLYVVPTFGWKRTRGETRESVRSGGGLRVYLDRPWFSSGDGELLGVVLWPAQLPAEEQALNAINPYVTRVGTDPIWHSSSMPSNLTIADFPGAVQEAPDPISGAPFKYKLSGLVLDELGAVSPVAVAPHRVAYDEIRQLWYCDIEVEPRAAYFPFIRLALARYQPRSMNGVHLSRVTLAEFAQLTPDRAASISFDRPKIHISVSGPMHHGSVAGTENSFEATLQRRADFGDETLGWTPVAAAATPLVRHPRADGYLPSVWQGELTLPGDGSRLRVMIREFEAYTVDSSTLRESRTAKRLVYAEAMEL